MRIPVVASFANSLSQNGLPLACPTSKSLYGLREPPSVWGERRLRLKRNTIWVPGLIFASISLSYWYIQLCLFDVMAWNYNVCYALFGFTFPFALSYLSCEWSDIQILNLRKVLGRIFAVPLHAWPLALVRTARRSTVRDLKEGVSWKPAMGVLFVLALSMGNEMWNDPITNGIPFTHAYQHFVADLAGMALFLAVTYIFSARQKRRMALRQA